MIRNETGIDDGLETFFTAHFHSNECLNKRSYSPELDLKSKVLRVFQSGITKPYDIKKAIECDYANANVIHTLNIRSIYNLISNNKQLFGRSNSKIHSLDVRALCFKLETPETVYMPYVFHYTSCPLVVCISSKCLLKKLCSATVLHIDATYRLIDCNYPVVILGFSDLNRSFFHSVIAIIETESEDVYTSILNSITLECAKLGEVFNPSVIVADNAAAISVASQKCFPDIKRVNCWAHIWRLMEKNLRFDSRFRDRLTNEIHFLQSIFDQTLFNQGMMLFVSKWSQIDEVSEFIQIFTQRYLECNSNWNEAFDIFSPSTNNCLEKFNATIKSRYMKMLRLDILSFIKKACLITEEHNLATPVISKMVYNEPDMESISDVALFTFQELTYFESSTFYTFAERLISPAEMSLIKSRLFREFATFNEFKAFYTDFVIVKVCDEIINWKSIICSCYKFVKHKKCLHVFLMLKKKEELDLIDINFLVHKKAKGRPKKLRANDSLNKNSI